MCGIVGYIGKRDAAPILMEGVHRLANRGYDSAGIAVAHSGELRLAKCKGRVRELEKLLPARFKGAPGIAHTRWATHGEPSDRNAHPHCDGANRIAVIHNGIIENAAALRARLEGAGVVFRSETDSEVLAHLIAAMPERSLHAATRGAPRRWASPATEARWCWEWTSAKCSSLPTLQPWCGTPAGSSTSTTARWRWYAPTGTRPRHSTAVRPPRPPRRSPGRARPWTRANSRTS